MPTPGLPQNKKTFERLMVVTGLALAIAGVWIGLKARTTDDFCYLYVLGRALTLRENPYDPAVQQPLFENALHAAPSNGSTAIFYPPSTGVVVIPLALLPYKAAQTLWFAILAGSLAIGVWQLVKVAAPQSTPGVRMLVVGLVLCSSAARWGMQVLQAAPLLVGLFCLFFAFLQQRKLAPAMIVATIALCLKPTIWLPFLGLLLLHRLFVMTAGILLTWLAVNGVGFLCIGGKTAIAAYRANMVVLDTTAGAIDSPNPYLPQSLPQLNWPYLLNAFHCGEANATRIGMLLTALAVLWLLREGWRAGKAGKEIETSIYFVLPTCCLTLLAVYHHHYDASILLAPLVLFGCTARSQIKPTPFYWAGLPAVMYICVASGRLVGEWAPPLFKLCGVIVTLLAFLYSLVALRQHLSAKARQSNAPVHAHA